MGFDCSGLVYYVYKEFGYRLNRVAADQAKNGSHVDYLDLLPGDNSLFQLRKLYWPCWLISRRWQVHPRDG
jgi:Cell wall-associated hydrolases (invasion-associated proteins)